MSRVAPQAQERFRLVQQIVSDRTVWRVANAAVLGGRWMFVSERALFLGMTPVAELIDGRFLQVAFRLPVPVVTIRAHHLAFLHRVMRWHGSFREDFGMALVARRRFIHGHGHPGRTRDVGVRDANRFLDKGLGVGVVTIGAGDTVETVA